MKYFRFLLFMGALAFSQQATAQAFIHNPTNDTLTFKDVQRQFDAWKRGKDISKIKGWKYFKRLEMEMALHTDGKGDPADPGLVINETLKVSLEKQKLQAGRFANAWYPVGPNAVPNNQTGYMENGVGRINCITFHPTNPSTYFVGVAQVGV